MHIWMKIIAVLEIVGGIAGILLVVWILAMTPFNPLSLLILPIVVGIYVLSLVAGIALWRGRKYGRTASIVVQCIQIPKLISPQIIFMFSFGVDVWVYFFRSPELFKIGFESRFGAFNQFFVYAPGAPYGLGISVTGLIILVLLITYKPNRTLEPIEPLPPPPPAEYRRGSTLGIN